MHTNGPGCDRYRGLFKRWVRRIPNIGMGTDQINPIVKTSDTLSPMLACLLNLTLSIGMVPSD